MTSALNKLTKRPVEDAARPAGHCVAIIGMGPKGLYCLERLLAEFSAAPLRRGLQIAVFNRSPYFGASPIYEPTQPDYLLVNIKVGEINLWDASNPPVVARGGSDFLTWYRQHYPERAPLTGEEYLARGVVGRYLIEGYRRMVDQAPAGVTVSSWAAEVVDLEPLEHGYALRYLSGTRSSSVAVDKVMLATGHSWLEPASDEQRWADFAERHAPAAFIPFVYPVEQRLAGIPAGSTVAMLGIGLTFIDAALALTEGRGGTFRRDGAGKLRYRPSGQEPAAILPFSRTGLPMSPKSQDLPLEPQPLRFLTEEALAQLRSTTPGGRLELSRDVWPLVELELELHYYRVACQGDPLWQQLERASRSPSDLRAALDGYLAGQPDLARFNYRAVLDPAAGRRFASGAEFNGFVQRYLQEQIVLSRLGQKGSAIKAAIDVWYQARGVLGSVLRYGGFTPPSHRTLVEDLFPAFKRVGFGPPVINIEKLSALQEAGIIDFSFARNPLVTPDERAGCFRLRSSMVPESSAALLTLVDARYPPVDVAHDATPLLRNLRRRGMLRAFENPGAPSYRPGAIDMADPGRFLVQENGEVNEDMAVIGIPTEGNLVGNLTLARDSFAGQWAATVMEQLRRREEAAASPLPRIANHHRDGQPQRAAADRSAE